MKKVLFVIAVKGLVYNVTIGGVTIIIDVATVKDNLDSLRYVHEMLLRAIGNHSDNAILSMVGKRDKDLLPVEDIIEYLKSFKGDYTISYCLDENMIVDIQFSGSMSLELLKLISLIDKYTM